MSSVSKNIEEIRLQRKLTQEELADKLSVTEQSVADWENGTSQPDIDTLIEIAGALETDATTLINGLPDPELRKKEKKQLVISGAILLVLGVSLYLLTKIAADMKSDFIMGPTVILQIFLLPLLWLGLGWASMQGLGVLGAAQPAKSKYNKAIHIASLTIVLLYAAVMLPFIIETIKVTILSIQYHQNPDLFPNGLHYSYNIPLFLQKIETSIMDAVYKQPIMFVIPGIIFWLSKRVK